MNLLDITDQSLVTKTNLSRKLTLGGVTKAYPVYKVRLDLLFYNDQNDRITTWITQYKNEIGDISVAELDREKYNSIIQKFIIDSNPSAIEKTKNNIALVQQREPGVVLADGRIIDGNRRFTCLRLLNAEKSGYEYFETVILDDSNENNQKQIKMLELAIQHGEEQRVDYNHIDMAVGAYHDIVETELLTVDEYASSTNETVSEVKKRLDIAQLIIEFLEFMNVPKQYHIAREMQVYSIFFELVPLLKRCDSDKMREEIKTSIFNNTMMGSFADQRKYIRDIKGMMDSVSFDSYMRKQKKIDEELSAKKEEADIKNEKELSDFVQKNKDITEDLQIALERSLMQTKKEKSKSRPSQIVTKSLGMLMDIDTRIFDKLSDTEKEKLHTQLNKLTDAVAMIDGEVNIDESSEAETKPEETGGKLCIAQKHKDEPFVYCEKENFTITNLMFSLPFTAYKYSDVQSEEVTYLAQFVNEEQKEISSLNEFTVRAGETIRVGFSLDASASSLKECYLVLKSSKDGFNEAQQIIKFKISISFSLDFNF